MEVKDFVRETLIQISKGITEAEETISGLGGIVNPPMHATQNSNNHAGQIEQGRNVYTVDFNIVVEISKEKEGNAKLSVISMFNAEGNAKLAQSNSTVNTISFAIPIAYPINEKLHTDYKKELEWEPEDLSSGMKYT